MRWRPRRTVPDRQLSGLSDRSPGEERVRLHQAEAGKFAYLAGRNRQLNCTGFISDVASYMGLRTPALMYPEDLVKAIKEPDEPCEIGRAHV